MNAQERLIQALRHDNSALRERIRSTTVATVIQLEEELSRKRAQSQEDAAKAAKVIDGLQRRIEKLSLSLRKARKRAESKQRRIDRLLTNQRNTWRGGKRILEVRA